MAVANSNLESELARRWKGARRVARTSSPPRPLPFSQRAVAPFNNSAIPPTGTLLLRANLALLYPSRDFNYLCLYHFRCAFHAISLGLVAHLVLSRSVLRWRCMCISLALIRRASLLHYAACLANVLWRLRSRCRVGECRDWLFTIFSYLYFTLI